MGQYWQHSLQDVLLQSPYHKRLGTLLEHWRLFGALLFDYYRTILDIGGGYRAFKVTLKLRQLPQTLGLQKMEMVQKSERTFE